MRRERLLAGILCMWMLAICLPALAQAPPSYAIQKEVALYGNLDQDDIPVWGGAAACGPTAAINSFVYLQNKYPATYDSSLIGDADNNGIPDQYQDLIAVAQTLGGPNYMNTIANNTTWHDDFIWGKTAYIENQVPGVTVYGAQDFWPWNNPARPKPAWVQAGYPTWGFIYNNLVSCEDVEILITWGVDSGHYLTVTGFNWTDLDFDGIIDQNEQALLSYIDPLTGGPGQTSIWNAAVGSDWKLEVGYNSAWISMVVKESVPEPASLLVLGTGLVGVIGFIRRRRA